MADQWYYWNSSDIHGPYSAKQLAGLVAEGDVLPDDIVWKQGVERGVPARTVKHLFPELPVGISQAAETLTPSVPPAVSSDVFQPATEAALAPAVATNPVECQPTPVQAQGSTYYPPVGRGRAVAGKGAVIVGQDGTTVKYRMKCTTCGHEDSSWRSVLITRGTTRSSFFCPKCRKRREVEVHGHLS